MVELLFHALNDTKSKLFTKIAKTTSDLEGYFFVPDFLVNNLDFMALRVQNNDSNTEIILEACSETSDYLRETISWS